MDSRNQNAHYCHENSYVKTIGRTGQKNFCWNWKKTNRFTEQALYYARSEHTEKDYSVREMALSQVVHQAIADNKYLLLQSGMRLEVEEMQDTVYSDEKWVRFILKSTDCQCGQVSYEAAGSPHFYS